MKKTWVLLFFALAMCKGGIEKETRVLKPQAFQEKLQATPDAMLIDVRSLSEVKEGYIKGQINFDFNAEEFRTLINGLDKKKTYFIYCAGGVRSAKTAEVMESMDFEKVYTLDGGFNAWKAAGLPVKEPGK